MQKKLQIIDPSSVRITVWVRIALATAAIVTGFIDHGAFGIDRMLLWGIFFGYLLHGLTLYALSRRNLRFIQTRLAAWLDVLWCALIIYCTGGVNSFFFLFFFFPILITSFQWGFKDGVRVTQTSAALFAFTAFAASDPGEIARLVVRGTFLLALGYMIAYWGGLEVRQKRRLDLLRDVSRLSNPRFGVEQTIASVLEKTRVFFNANQCVLVMRDAETDTWSLRIAGGAKPTSLRGPEPISAVVATPLVALPANALVAAGTSGRWNRFIRSGPACHVYDESRCHWTSTDAAAAKTVCDLLEAPVFISVPISLSRGRGRMYVTAQPDCVDRSDALFLLDIAVQVFPVIENIALLDRLASGAALRERERIARDLHDSTIQPYIGLTHGLTALRNKATACNPLRNDIDHLINMATEVIGDLRRYAVHLEIPQVGDEPTFVTALRRQAAQAQDFYGIDILISLEGDFSMNDRMAAEVHQIISEGLSNIQKHTLARSGMIRLVQADGLLQINICNDQDDQDNLDNQDNRDSPRPPAFTPRSIAARAAALGGTVRVAQDAVSGTAVLVEIPV